MLFKFARLLNSSIDALVVVSHSVEKCSSNTAHAVDGLPFIGFRDTLSVGRTENKYFKHSNRYNRSFPSTRSSDCLPGITGMAVFSRV